MMSLVPALAFAATPITGVSATASVASGDTVVTLTAISGTYDVYSVDKDGKVALKLRLILESQ